MQAFVVRDDLLHEAPDTPVHVIATYANEQATLIEQHGTEYTVVTVPDDKIVRESPAPGMPPMFMVLKSDWRESYVPVINAEASRRILLVFPEYRQRNSTAAVQDYITRYGADVTVWPQAAKDVKAESDRGWTYVHDVRTAANAWTAMPVDPTADSIWPPAITPIVFMPT
jgi:hypothetical protein